MLEIVKASAGAGKTHFLTREYLILAYKNPYAFKQILAVTFTNKAAEEMKQRIVVELAILANEQESDFLADIISAYPKDNESNVRSKAKSILEIILHNYSDFAVSTIDSFMQSLIKAFSYEIGIQKSYKLILDTDEVKEELIDTLFEESRKDVVLQKWFEKFILYKIAQGKTWNILDDLNSFSNELFKEEYQQIDFSQKHDTDDFYDKIKEKLENEILIFEEKLKSISKKAQKIIEQQQDTLSFNGLKHVKIYLGEKIVNFSKTDNLIPNKTVRKAIIGIENWGKGKMKANEENYLEQIFNKLNPLLEEAVNLVENESRNYFTSRSLLRNFFNFVIMREMEKLLPKYRENNNALLISDLNKLLYEISKNNEAFYIYDKVGARLSNILIDEFQDTSKFQWENFKPLINNNLAEGNKNIIVGDIKQSVYRWRSGDWQLLHSEVKREFEYYVSELSLEFNYRSKQNIIFFNNTIFKSLAHLIQQSINLEIEETASAEDNKKLESSNFKSVIYDVYADVMQKMPKNNTRKGGKINIQFYDSSDKDYVDENLPVLIENLLLERNFRPNDLAILVRTNREGDLIAQLLYNYMNESNEHLKYDIIAPSSLSLGNSTSINALVNALQYFFNQDDKISLVALINNIYQLQSNNINHQLLEDIDDDFVFAYLPEEFWKLMVNLTTYPLYEIVERLIDILNLNSKSEQAFILKFLDELHEFSSRELASYENFFKWWKIKGSKLSVQVSEQLDALRILTIHKSKGLAFNVVIMPSLEMPTNYLGLNQPNLWVKNNWEGIDAGILSVRYSKELLKTYYSEQYLHERVQVAMDALNVLYVAFTRPKLELIAYASKAKRTGSKISEFLFTVFSQPTILSPSENEINLSEYWNPEEKLFSFDLDNKPIKRTGKSQDELIVLKNDLKKADWREKITFRSSVDEFVIQSIQALHDKVSYGKLMHQIMAKIKYADELEDALKELHAENFISKELLIEIQPKISAYVNHKLVSDWYSRNWDVLNEQGIITQDGELRIPDRLIKNEKMYIVIDYKFAIQSDEHKEQVGAYIKILKNMQALPVEGYLYYPETAQIIKVDEGSL